MESFETMYDSFFGPVLKLASSYSAAHGMVLEKYYHEAPVLTFGFGHPLGGQAKIDVDRLDDKHIQVQPVRWLDDRSTFTRSLKWGSKRSCLVSATELAPLLDAALHECLSWGATEWTKVAGGYELIWSGIPESEFSAFANHWPRLQAESRP
jgi:hypothetical protein